MRSRRLQWVKVLRGYRKKMMPVMHSQFQTRRAGLDSLTPLSNRLGAYEKELRPDPPNRSGNITESRSIYQFGTSSATHLRFNYGGFQFGRSALGGSPLLQQGEPDFSPAKRTRF